MPLPNVRDDEAPLNTWMRRAAPIAALALLPLVAFAQYFLRGHAGLELTRPPAEVAASEEWRPPAIDDLTVQSKFLLKGLFFAQQNGMVPDIPNDPERAKDKHLGRYAEDGEFDEAVPELRRLAVSRVDRVRLAITLGEVEGPSAALAQLESLTKEAEPGGHLAGELHWLKAHYARMVKGSPSEMPPETRDSLVARHGWFGHIALTFGEHASNTERWRALTGFGNVLALVLVLLVLGVLAFLGGIIALCVIVAKHRSGDLDSDYGETIMPRFIFMETFALFLLAFVVTILLGVVLLDQKGVWAVAASEVLLWAVALTALWPLARGVSWPELKINLGLTTGAGVVKETLIGFAAFLAGLPLAILAGYIIEIFSAFGGQEEVSAGPSGYPMFEQPLEGSWLLLSLSAFAAVVWAPLVEETLFRGALHRYLSCWGRSWMRVLITATVFGLVHPYSPSGMFQVAVGGVVYGALREWRGSLIAPMVAHALHNGTIMLVTVAFLLAIG